MEQSVCRAALCRVFALILLLLLSPSVFAYLDPSTGSMVVSVLVGVFASIGLALRTYWYKIKSFFKRIGKPATNAANEPSTEE
jgi:amino acid permease